ncbi:MAG: 4a-hydroxytetrahydrobiopterin dehydratase [Acidobacteriota bacterium]
MSLPRKLSQAEIETELAKLDGWSLRDGKLHREIRFPDFVSAFGFMTQVALIAETMQHHPDWSNVYGTVTFDLSTHDVDGLSPKDFALAVAIDGFAP